VDNEHAILQKALMAIAEIGTKRDQLSKNFKSGIIVVSCRKLTTMMFGLKFFISGPSEETSKFLKVSR
jgi:hypothetical protein